MRAAPLALAALGCALALGCSRLRVRGGRSISQEETALLSVVRSYQPVRCVDPHGRPLAALPRETLFLAPRDGNDYVLLIVRADRDSWLVEPAFHDGGEQVFQLSLEGGDAGPLLRDVRLTHSGGRMAFVRRWTERRTRGSERAFFARAELSCELALSTGEGA